jgi:hypothetical protein
LYHNQSVAKLASQGTMINATNNAAMIVSSIRRIDTGSGGSRPGPGRSKGDVI